MSANEAQNGCDGSGEINLLELVQRKDEFEI